MSSNFRTFYLYTVALITLIMIIGGIVATVNNITSYFFPDSYVFFEEETSSEYIIDDNLKYDYSDEEDYNSARKNEIRRQNYKNEKIKNIEISIVVTAVGSIMYKYHWNIIEKESMR